ncbi:MAG TPA: hypothetical protein VH163_05855 [Gemmatimonadales bacterium]|nr:hypothetical protein [Gemmatimonadales bacterium]
MNPRRTLSVALLLAAACTTPDAPSHTGAYAFDSNGNGSGNVFHWPADRLPVRFWVDPRGNLNALVQNAIDVWQDQLIYGEFTGVIVSDSAHADVQFVWADTAAPTVPPDEGPPVPACGGLTQNDSVGANDHRIYGALHSSINLLVGSFTPGQVEACVRRTVIHEMGHTLGILAEAPDSTDIMFPTPKVPLPSPADRTTIQIRYHTTPTLLPPIR